MEARRHFLIIRQSLRRATGLALKGLTAGEQTKCRQNEKRFHMHRSASYWRKRTTIKRIWAFPEQLIMQNEITNACRDLSSIFDFEFLIFYSLDVIARN
jgi:hypothetical protein